MSDETLRERTYLERLHDLEHAYPALKSFLAKVDNHDEGRKIVSAAYQKRFERCPGRCALIIFHEDRVETHEFPRPADLTGYLNGVDAAEAKDQCRLWILEDLDPSWINTLGALFCVDPLVFGEQMNTWNFTDSKSIPMRVLPSMIQPEKSFTLRYYEFRQLKDGNAIDHLRNQMTFAVNRRRYERWRDIDTTSFESPFRHAFVRRCASFWTNQEVGKKGWDGRRSEVQLSASSANHETALMLVDPAFDSFKWEMPADANAHTPTTGSRRRKPARPAAPAAEPAAAHRFASCTILQDPRHYRDRRDMWNAMKWEQVGSVGATEGTSVPYHDGCRTLTAACPHTNQVLEQHNGRNLSSPLDEVVFHWQYLADKALIMSAREHAVNSAHFLLNYIALYWTNQLDLIACGVAQSEYFADDHQASIDAELSSAQWKAELQGITNTTQDINYMKRQLSHFQRAMISNLERLGLVYGAESLLAQEAPNAPPAALRNAQRDFLAIHNKLKPYCDRIDSLSGVANELANLHTAFQSIKSGEFGVRLSLFAVVVFPMTLVTSILSIPDRYGPGKDMFWVYWAVAAPLVFVLCGALVWREPEKWVGERARGAVKRLGEWGRGKGEKGGLP